MTIESNLRKQQFTLDGVTADFTYTFRGLPESPTDIKAIATASSVDTALVYTTDFTVVPNENGVGGILTLVDPAAVGSGTLTVYRETTNRQESDYDDFTQFPAHTLENDLDIRTLVAQEQEEALDRTLRLPISIDGVDCELPAPEAGKVIGWNDTEDGLENITPGSGSGGISNGDTITIDLGNYLYFGDSATNGSWRVTVSSGSLVMQKRESAVWVEKGAFDA